ncbi:MAG: alanine racemase [Longimicrobiales bacterium]
MIDRRGFISAAGIGLVGNSLKMPERPAATATPNKDPAYGPWIEVDSEALRTNVARVYELAGRRPILAVVKNNAYGLGLQETASILEPMPEIGGFAVVKPEAAADLRTWGLEKPVLLMGLADDDASVELARKGVELSLYLDDSVARAKHVFEATGSKVAGQIYLDTGMGRMGIESHRALPWLADLSSSGLVDVRGTFMAFTENPDFDQEQLLRFKSFADQAKAAGAALGRLHAASSNGVYHLPEAHLDMVRPGIALFGAYPSRPDEERAKQALTSAVRLCARVVRVQRLRIGDGVSYGRNYVAEQPTWTATLPVGHTDGYPRGAVEGAQALIGEQLYPIIGAVSASHCIVEVGDEPLVAVGDKAVLLGSDRPEIEPNNIAEASSSSVYDILMHLNPQLPRVVV